MAYEVVVAGRAEGALRAELADQLRPGSIRVVDGMLTLSIPDQSALAAVIGQLNDLNVSIEIVRNVGAEPAAGR